MPKFNDLDLKNWKEYEDIYTDTLWIIEKRDNSGVHTSKYHGNFIPQIPNQLFRRYTKKGDWILDPFLGSGTSIIEAQRLGRNSIGIELQEDVLKETYERILIEKNNDCRGKLYIGDSKEINISKILKSNSIEKVQFIIFHPPYWDIIKFSDKENDLSNSKTVEEFLSSFGKVIDNTTEYLEKNREKLNDRATVKNEGRIWWRYSRPMHKEYYHLNKIWCSYRSTINEFCYDDTKEYIGLTNTTVIFDTNEKIKLKYLLTILNSKLFKFRYSSIGKQTGSGVYEYFANGVGKFPIKEISLQKQEPFIEKADKMLALNKELQKISQKFQRMIMRELGLEKISTKLQNWYLLNFDEFIKELSKVKVKLSLSQKADWEDYFIAEKSKAETLNNKITKTDKEIDGMVYELYGLSEEEVRVVEAN